MHTTRLQKLHHQFANVAKGIVAAVRKNEHRADVCQCVVQLTPIPALPAYYCLYRAFSHRQALAGCRALTDAFSHHDAQQLQVPLYLRCTHVCFHPNLLQRHVKHVARGMHAFPSAAYQPCCINQ